EEVELPGADRLDLGAERGARRDDQPVADEERRPLGDEEAALDPRRRRASPVEVAEDLDLREAIGEAHDALGRERRLGAPALLAGPERGPDARLERLDPPALACDEVRPAVVLAEPFELRLRRGRRALRGLRRLREDLLGEPVLGRRRGLADLGLVLADVLRPRELLEGVAEVAEGAPEVARRGELARPLDDAARVLLDVHGRGRRLG